MTKALKLALAATVFTAISLAQDSTLPVARIVARVTKNSTGNFVIYVPSGSANFRATVYLESSDGASKTCASMSWYDDNNNPQTSENVCSDSSAKGGFVLPIRAKAGTNIWINVNSSAGPAFVTLEQL